MNNNPFNIPDLTPMHDAVRDYIKEHQGEQGFINTQDERADTIWTMVYTGYDSEYYEHPVAAVRVKNDCIQILYDEDDYYYYCDSSDILKAEDKDWYIIQYDDCIVYLNTIFSIAENIEQYVER